MRVLGFEMVRDKNNTGYLQNHKHSQMISSKYKIPFSGLPASFLIPYIMVSI
ncbi:hypothetical protein [Chryseobacterium sp. Marseille-Q8038]